MPDKAALKERVLAELKSFSVTVAYLWALLSVFEIHRLIILRQQNLTYAIEYRVGFALINAFILGKIIAIADAMHVSEHVQYKRLVYTILYKSALFTAILIAFELMEETVVGVFHGKTITQSFPKMGGGGLEGILLVGIIMFVVLIPFFGFREIAQAVGEEEFRSLMLGRGTSTQADQSEGKKKNPTSGSAA